MDEKIDSNKNGRFHQNLVTSYQIYCIFILLSIQFYSTISI